MEHFCSFWNKSLNELLSYGLPSAEMKKVMEINLYLEFSLDMEVFLLDIMVCEAHNHGDNMSVRISKIDNDNTDIEQYRK